MAKFNPKTISWWHEQLADWMLLNPDRHLVEAAKVFDVGVNYLYLLKNSDSFKAYWEFRRKTQVEKIGDVQVKNLTGGVLEKVNAMADMALDQILQQLEDNAKASEVGAPLLDHSELRSTADMALKKLGYGIAPAASGGGGGVNTQINLTINSADLAAAREKMKQLHGVEPAGPAMIELTPMEKEDDESKV